MLCLAKKLKHRPPKIDFFLYSPIGFMEGGVKHFLVRFRLWLINYKEPVQISCICGLGRRKWFIKGRTYRLVAFGFWYKKIKVNIRRDQHSHISQCCILCPPSYTFLSICYSKFKWYAKWYICLTWPHARTLSATSTTTRLYNPHTSSSSSHAHSRMDKSTYTRKSAPRIFKIIYSHVNFARMFLYL